MTALLYATDDSAEEALKWVDPQSNAITTEALRNSLTNPESEVEEAGVERARALCKILYLIFSGTCEAEPHRMGGHGVEAWRMLHRYASKRPGAKRAPPQALFTM